MAKKSRLWPQRAIPSSVWCMKALIAHGEQRHMTQKDVQNTEEMCDLSHLTRTPPSHSLTHRVLFEFRAHSFHGFCVTAAKSCQSARIVLMLSIQFLMFAVSLRQLIFSWSAGSIRYRIAKSVCRHAFGSGLATSLLFCNHDLAQLVRDWFFHILV